MKSNVHDSEIKRLQFLINRDGYRATRDFALRTLRAYRTVVLEPDKSRCTDRAMVESYLMLKDFYFRTHPLMQVDI